MTHLLNIAAAMCILALLGGLAKPAIGLERFDFDQRYLIQPGFIIKDHTVVQRDGAYHIFYIKADETVSVGETAKSLGHASSKDLINWTFYPDVVHCVPNTWEESFIWAPHIVEHRGTYYMFYTGVNRFYSQAIGLAVSKNLLNWTKVGTGPVYTPDPSWAKWDTSSWSNCRDPYVVRDGNQWHMLTTAWTADFKGAISHATSTNLLDWQDQGPLFVHPGPKAWHVLESANLHQNNGQYFLFFTEEQVGGTHCMMAPTLDGPWNYESRQYFDAGHAVELRRLEKRWLLSRHDAFPFEGRAVFVIKFDDLSWSLPAMPVIQPSTPVDDWSVISGTAFVDQPIFWDNTAARGAGPANFSGNSWIGSMDHYGGQLRFGEPGDTIGEDAVGVLRSPAFKLGGNSITFRIGGTQDIDNVYLALCRERDGTVLQRSTGGGTETMSDQAWNVAAWKGERVYIEIVDASETGHINVDQILETNAVLGKRSKRKPGPLALEIVLHPNVPNPFNPATTIAFEVAQPGRAVLSVFDVRGQLVRQLLDERVGAGHHAVTWDGREASGSLVPSGVYYYQLEMDDRAPITRAMHLVK